MDKIFYFLTFDGFTICNQLGLGLMITIDIKYILSRFWPEFDLHIFLIQSVDFTKVFVSTHLISKIL